MTLKQYEELVHLLGATGGVIRFVPEFSTSTFRHSGPADIKKGIFPCPHLGHKQIIKRENGSLSGCILLTFITFTGDTVIFSTKDSIRPSYICANMEDVLKVVKQKHLERCEYLKRHNLI